MALGTAENKFPLSRLDARSFAGGKRFFPTLFQSTVVPLPSHVPNNQYYGKANDHGKSSR